jgi:hypothetical protein
MRGWGVMLMYFAGRLIWTDLSCLNGTALDDRLRGFRWPCAVAGALARQQDARTHSVEEQRVSTAVMTLRICVGEIADDQTVDAAIGAHGTSAACK